MTLHPDEILAARILIVDDQAANVRLLERLLGDAGYRGVSSTMEPRAVAALHTKHVYDAILLDLQMPGFDGFQVMTALRQDDVDGDGVLPVIVLTAQPELKLRALQAGARDFISKPFDLVEVKTRIHHMLETRLLYRRLATHAELLEAAVIARTAELRASEARYRSLTELASDWHWQQDESGQMTSAWGPVDEMLGLGRSAPQLDAGVVPDQSWNETERDHLRAAIAARQPFLDYSISRVDSDGSRHVYRVSGEPMFTQACRFIGYRGIGVEVMSTAP